MIRAARFPTQLLIAVYIYKWDLFVISILECLFAIIVLTESGDNLQVGSAINVKHSVLSLMLSTNTLTAHQQVNFRE